MLPRKQDDSPLKLFDIMNNRTRADALPYITSQGLLNITKFLEQHDQCDDKALSYQCQFPYHSIWQYGWRNFSFLYAQNIYFKNIFCDFSFDHEDCAFDHSRLENSKFDTLHAISIRNSNLTNTNFVNAKLTKVTIQHSIVDGVNFNNGNFRHFLINDSAINQVSFHHAILNSTGLFNSFGKDLDFRNVTFASGFLSNDTISNINFSDATFTTSHLFWRDRVIFYEDNNLKNIIFENSSFKKTSFLNDLSGANFRYTNLDHCFFEGIFTLADFEGAYLNQTTLRRDLQGTRFHHAVLDRCLLEGVFSLADFEDTTFIFDNAKKYLQKGTFDDANFCNATINNANRLLIKPHDINKFFRANSASAQHLRFCNNDTAPHHHRMKMTTFLPIITLGGLAISLVLILLVLGIGYLLYRRAQNQRTQQDRVGLLGHSPLQNPCFSA